MDYISTRDNNIKITSSQAIVKGISDEGGLFVPSSIPTLTEEEISLLVGKSYEERAVYILSKYLSDFKKEEIFNCVNNAYGGTKFDDDAKAPISKLYPNLYFLELWHGPTSAFKDMALQLLPHLLVTSAKKNEVNDKIIILVATSGDTGKAALEGFKDVENTEVIVFYPENGVSPMQKKQMQTQAGKNVKVCAIKGNFDDAQSAVKTIFTNEEIKSQLKEKGMRFSSANSINWGRLVPQIVYYVSCYCELIKQEEIAYGEKINVVVPTGNFGNILAAYYAKHMGVPINKLICASNKNNVLTDFFNTGTYDRNREFYPSISPSMDILISSNLERLIYMLSGSDSYTSSLMDSLSKTGKYTVSKEIKAKMDEEFFAYYCTDEEAKAEIEKIYSKYAYVLDTHTADAVVAYDKYISKTNDDTKTVIASTANPYKFSSSVLSAICGEELSFEDDYEAVKLLFEKTELTPPENLMCLKEKPCLHNTVIDKKDIISYTKEALGL